MHTATAVGCRSLLLLWWTRFALTHTHSDLCAISFSTLPFPLNLFAARLLAPCLSRALFFALRPGFAAFGSCIAFRLYSTRIHSTFCFFFYGFRVSSLCFYEPKRKRAADKNDDLNAFHVQFYTMAMTWAMDDGQPDDSFRPKTQKEQKMNKN